MKKERILAYAMSQQLSEEDLNEISAAGMTTSYCGSVTCNHQSGCEGQIDVSVDL